MLRSCPNSLRELHFCIDSLPLGLYKLLDEELPQLEVLDIGSPGSWSWYTGRYSPREKLNAAVMTRTIEKDFADSNQIDMEGRGCFSKFRSVKIDLEDEVKRQLILHSPRAEVLDVSSCSRQSANDITLRHTGIRSLVLGPISTSKFHDFSDTITQCHHIWEVTVSLISYISRFVTITEQDPAFLTITIPFLTSLRQLPSVQRVRFHVSRIGQAKEVYDALTASVQGYRIQVLDDDNVEVDHSLLVLDDPNDRFGTKGCGDWLDLVYVVF